MGRRMGNQQAKAPCGNDEEYLRFGQRGGEIDRDVYCTVCMLEHVGSVSTLLCMRNEFGEMGE